MGRPNEGRGETLTARISSELDDLVREYAEERGIKRARAASDLIAEGLASVQGRALEDQRRAVGVEGYRALVHNHLTHAHRLIGDLAKTEPVAARTMAVEMVAGHARFAADLSRHADEWIGANLTKRAKKR